MNHYDIRRCTKGLAGSLLSMAIIFISSACNNGGSDICHDFEHVVVYAPTGCIQGVTTQCDGFVGPLFTSVAQCPNSLSDQRVAEADYNDVDNIKCTVTFTCADGSQDVQSFSWTRGSGMECQHATPLTATVCSAAVGDGGVGDGGDADVE